VKHRWIFIFAALVAFSQAKAADPMLHQMAVTYGNPALSQTHVLASTGQDQEAQSIFCGTDGSCDFFGIPRTLSARTGLLVGRLDATGKLVRAHVYDPGSTYLDQVIRGSDGGYFLAIDTRSSFGGSTVDRGRGLVLKLSPDGKPVWATLISAPYGKDSAARVNSVVEGPDGSLIVIGVCTDGKYDDEKDDLAVLKLTPTGRPLWSHCYRFDQPTFGEHAQLRPDGSIVLSAMQMIDGQFDHDSLLFSLSPDGVPQQVGQFAIDEGTFYANEIFARPDGGMLVTGGLSTRRTEVQDRGVVLRIEADRSVKTARSYEVAGEFQPYESVILPESVALLGSSDSLKPYINSAVALLVGQDGRPRAAVVGTLFEPGTDHTTYNDFEGIIQRPSGQYLLLGSTPAFNDKRNLEMLTTLWTPAANSTSAVTVASLHAKLLPVTLPKVYEGKLAIESLDISQIEIVDVTPKE